MSNTGPSVCDTSLRVAYASSGVLDTPPGVSNTPLGAQIPIADAAHLPASMARNRADSGVHPTVDYDPFIKSQPAST